jgi:hypothetical protein
MEQVGGIPPLSRAPTAEATHKIGGNVSEGDLERALLPGQIEGPNHRETICIKAF